MNVSLTVYGPNRPLHSGHYGNWAPNPALRLAKLLASMKDDQGKVIVPGWYDDVVPLGQTEKQAIAAAAEYDATLNQQLGLGATETDLPLNEAIALPSLNINGMRSGNVGRSGHQHDCRDRDRGAGSAARRRQRSPAPVRQARWRMSAHRATTSSIGSRPPKSVWLTP